MKEDSDQTLDSVVAGATLSPCSTVTDKTYGAFSGSSVFLTMSKRGIGTSDELLQNCKTNTMSVHCYGHKNRVLIFHYIHYIT